MLQAPLPAIRDKSVALGCLFWRLMEQECSQWGFRLASPAAPAQRGSQICFAHPEGYAIMQVCPLDSCNRAPGMPIQSESKLLW